VLAVMLFAYRTGKIGDIHENMRHEVRQAMWIALEDAAAKLSYKGEKGVAKLAQEYVAAHPDL
jgi:hypothetical protein